MDDRKTLGVKFWRQIGPMILLALVVLCSPGANGLKPKIADKVENITVALGRDAKLQCQVKDLQDYKVAWIHIDRQMILTIGENVITRIPRFSISHGDLSTWTLQIDDVQAEDRGYYMCQVNTDPMISVTGHLDVVVPPTISDEDSSPSEVSVRETHNTTLNCHANGEPKPTITWRREDGKSIFRDNENHPSQGGVPIHHGEDLHLQTVSREQMGAYLCIASNKIPPSVSKRIKLVVEFAPMMYIPNQLIGAPLATKITLECQIEASPKAITYWVYDGQMILRSSRYDTEEDIENYRTHSKLTIFNIRAEDFGMYKCVSKNSLGEQESNVRLYEVESPSTPRHLSYYEPHLPTTPSEPIVQKTTQKSIKPSRQWKTTERSVMTFPAPTTIPGLSWWEQKNSGGPRMEVLNLSFVFIIFLVSL